MDCPARVMAATPSVTEPPWLGEGEGGLSGEPVCCAPDGTTSSGSEGTAACFPGVLSPAAEGLRARKEGFLTNPRKTPELEAVMLMAEWARARECKYSCVTLKVLPDISGLKTLPHRGRSHSTVKNPEMGKAAQLHCLLFGREDLCQAQPKRNPRKNTQEPSK